MIMGEDFTAQVFKHLSDREVKLLGENMAQVKKVDPKTVSSVMDEFSRAMGEDGIGISGRDFLQKAMPKAFDSKKSDDILGDLLNKSEEKTFEKLSAMNPRTFTITVTQNLARKDALLDLWRNTC